MMYSRGNEMNNVNATLSLIEDALESALEDNDVTDNCSKQKNCETDSSRFENVSEFTLPMSV